MRTVPGNFRALCSSNEAHDVVAHASQLCRRYPPTARFTLGDAVTPRSRRCALIEKLDFLVRFWELKARNASLGEPLGSQEQIELLSLMQLVTGDLESPPAGP